MADLEVRPQTASLTAGQNQQFGAFQNGQPVKVAWSLQPSSKDAGTIEELGIYTAPRQIFRTRKVAVVARAADGSLGSAIVELVPLAFWTHFLGAYLLASLILILLMVTLGWEKLCPTCQAKTIRISPPVVTLGPSQSQLFTANVPVHWTGGTLDSNVEGLYTAPANPKLVKSKGQLIAKAAGLPQAGADVFFSSQGGLSLQPARAAVTAGGSIDLAAVLVPPPPDPNLSTTPSPPEVHWLSPAIGTLTPTSATGAGSLTARFSIGASAVDFPTTVLVIAQTQETPPRTAGAWITVKPATLLTGVCEDCESFNIGGLLILLALMGALGSIVHAISSFTTFVGNRKFLTSWAWWYIFKPFLGGLVALAVFLVFRAGFGIGNYSLDKADCLKSAAFAILIGLFAEQATIKMKDIFDALFTPRKEQRQDPASGGNSSGPTLVSLDPPSVTVGQDIHSLTLHGTGFAKDCQVKIGAELRKPTNPLATTLTVEIKPADIAKSGEVPVIVYNKPPESEPSNILKLKVT